MLSATTPAHTAAARVAPASRIASATPFCTLPSVVLQDCHWSQELINAIHGALDHLQLIVLLICRFGTVLLIRAPLRGSLQGGRLLLVLDCLAVDGTRHLFRGVIFVDLTTLTFVGSALLNLTVLFGSCRCVHVALRIICSFGCSLWLILHALFVYDSDIWWCVWPCKSWIIALILWPTSFNPLLLILHLSFRDTTCTTCLLLKSLFRDLLGA